MLTDTRIIARQSAAAGAIEVLAQRHEVLWRDGTAVQLHPVQAHGLPMLTHRAVEIGTHLVLLDLARLPGLGRTLDAELRRAPPRDQVGTVWLMLRAHYRSAEPFVADAQRHAAGSWWPVGDGGFVWQATARAVDAGLLATTAAAVLPASVLSLGVGAGVAAC